MEATVSNSFTSFISMKMEITKRALSKLARITSISVETGQSTSTAPPPTGDFEWLMKLLGLCFTALGAAIQSLQYLKSINQSSTVPSTFYLFCTTLLAALVALLLSRFLPPDASILQLRGFLNQLGLFFILVSFFPAITLVFPFWIKFTTWAIFIITILIIILSYSFQLHSSHQSASSDLPLSSEMDLHIHDNNDSIV